MVRAIRTLFRVQAKLVPHHVNDACALGRGKHSARFLRVCGERLFTQNVATARKRSMDERRMGARWRCNGDSDSAGFRDSRIQIDERVRHRTARGAISRADGVGTHQADDLKAGVPQRRHEHSLSVSGAGDQHRDLVDACSAAWGITG